MRKIGNLISLMWALNVCIGCHEKHDDSLFFNGEIQTIKDSGKETKKVALKPVFLDGTNFGYIAVYDSLMFFMNPKLPDRFYNIFNITREVALKRPPQLVLFLNFLSGKMS